MMDALLVRMGCDGYPPSEDGQVWEDSDWVEVKLRWMANMRAQCQQESERLVSRAALQAGHEAGLQS